MPDISQLLRKEISLRSPLLRPRTHPHGCHGFPRRSRAHLALRRPSAKGGRVLPGRTTRINSSLSIAAKSSPSTTPHVPRPCASPTGLPLKFPVPISAPLISASSAAMQEESTFRTVRFIASLLMVRSCRKSSHTTKPPPSVTPEFAPSRRLRPSPASCATLLTPSAPSTPYGPRLPLQRAPTRMPKMGQVTDEVRRSQKPDPNSHGCKAKPFS